MERPIDPAKVQEIMDTELTVEQIAPYVTGANVFVEGTLVGKGLSDDLLAQLEIWITAHMIALSRERTAKSEEAGGAKIVYAGEWGQMFSATSYGQMALTLDTSGTLQTLMKNKKAWIRAVKTV